MKIPISVLVATLALNGCSGVASTLRGGSPGDAEKYKLKDAGDFQPTGHRIEFADRYGWRTYAVDFRFGLDQGGRALTENSRITLKITKRDGKTWDTPARLQTSSR